MQPHILDTCPVHSGSIVLVDFGNGDQYIERAGHLDWGPGGGPLCDGRIRLYAELIAGPNTVGVRSPHHITAPSAPYP